jgi:hypothetical protein
LLVQVDAFLLRLGVAFFVVLELADGQGPALRKPRRPFARSTSMY